MRKLGIGRAHGIGPAGIQRRARPDRAWRARGRMPTGRCDKRYGAQSPQLHSNGAPLYADGRPCRSATTSTSPSVRGTSRRPPLQDGCRVLLRCKWRNRRDAHLGVQIDDNQRRRRPAARRPPSRHVNLPAGVDAIRAGLHDATSQPGALLRRLQWLPGAGLRQDRHSRARRRRGIPVLVHVLGRRWLDTQAARPAVVARDDRARGFGAQAAAPAARLILSQWIGAAPGMSSAPRTRCDPRPRDPRVSANPIQRSVEDATPPRGTQSPLRLDWLPARPRRRARRAVAGRDRRRHAGRCRGQPALLHGAARREPAPSACC